MKKPDNAVKTKQKKKQSRVQYEKGKAPDNKRVLDKPKGETETRIIFRERDKIPGSGALTHALERPASEAVSAVRSQTSKYEKDNVGVQSFNATERAAGKAFSVARSVHSKLRFEPQRRLLQAEKKAVNANVNAIYKRNLRTNPELKKANAVKKALYKRRLKKNYAQAFRQANAKGAKAAAKTTKATMTAVMKIKLLLIKIKILMVKAVKLVIASWKILLIAGALLLLIILLAAGISSCMAMFGGGGVNMIATSYTAEDECIIGANDDYTALQTALAEQIANIPSTNPGFDEYNFSLDPITHDPFGLASYLTAIYLMYTRAGVQGDLAAILAAQYTLTLTPVTEIRTREEERTGTGTDEDGNPYTYTYTETVEYEWHILNITLVNHGIEAVAVSNLDAEQLEMFYILMSTKGNRPELFP